MCCSAIITVQRCNFFLRLTVKKHPFLYIQASLRQKRESMSQRNDSIRSQIEIQSEYGLAGSILYAQNLPLLHPLNLFFEHSRHFLGISRHFLQQFEGHRTEVVSPRDLRSRFPRRSFIGAIVRVSWSGLWSPIDDERTANNTRKLRK